MSHCCSHHVLCFVASSLNLYRLSVPLSGITWFLHYLYIHSLISLLCQCLHNNYRMINTETYPLSSNMKQREIHREFIKKTSINSLIKQIQNTTTIFLVGILPTSFINQLRATNISLYTMHYHNYYALFYKESVYLS